MKTGSTDLTALYGNSAANALASAYESALLTLTLGQWRLMPNRKIRLALVEAMMAEGEQNGFAAERMTEAGLAAVAGSAPSIRT